ARRLGRAQPARSLRHPGHAEERRLRRAAFSRDREAQLRRLEQGHRARQRRRRPHRPRPGARRAAREISRRGGRRAIRAGDRRPHRVRRRARGAARGRDDRRSGVPAAAPHSRLPARPHRHRERGAAGAPPPPPGAAAGAGAAPPAPGPGGDVWFLSATSIPSFASDGGLFAATSAIGLDAEATVLAVLRSAAVRHGLQPLLDPARPRAGRRRTGLRVGLAFNMKRIESHAGDDREAEYDAPETIQSITRAIESPGHVVVPLEATPEFPRALMASKVDVVFNIAEGLAGRSREAQVPSLCELLGVPYTGSDPATLSICLDKALAKRLLVDIDAPAFQVLITGREKLRPLRYPVIVKPNQEGTSKGITGKSVCDDEACLREVARELIDRYGQPALVEEYVFGREFTVGLLGERRPRVLPPMEVVFLAKNDRPVYDYACKQDWPKHVRYECPARLSKDELRAIERACRTTFM